MPPTRKTRIVLISDTHNQTPKLPPGDILIHAGDLTNQGSYDELQRTVEWLERSEFEAKVIIAGTSPHLHLTLGPQYQSIKSMQDVRCQYEERFEFDV